MSVADIVAILTLVINIVDLIFDICNNKKKKPPLLAIERLFPNNLFFGRRTAYSSAPLVIYIIPR